LTFRAFARNTRGVSLLVSIRNKLVQKMLKMLKMLKYLAYDARIQIKMLTISIYTQPKKTGFNRVTQ